ncbi:MAG: hypothetical protein Kow0059_00750 [Candidatus Sumerlaeia bacterium]
MKRRSAQLAVMAAALIVSVMALAGSAGQPKVLNLIQRSTAQGDALEFQTTGAAAPALQREADSQVLLVKFPGATPGPAVAHFACQPTPLIKSIEPRMAAARNGQTEFVVAVDLAQWVPYTLARGENGHFTLQFLTASDAGAAESARTGRQPVPALGSDAAGAPAQGEQPEEPKPFKFWTPDAKVPIPEYKAEEVQQRIMEDKIFNQMITLELKDAPMQDVIRLIARKAKLNIIMNQNQVQGTVTVKLENVPLGTALDAILKTNDLAYVREEGGIVRIVPRSEIRGARAVVETQTVNIPVNWLPAENVAATIKPFLSPDGRIQASKESNSVIITDVPPKVAEARLLINEIDIPEKQVMIEARLIDMTEEARRAMGIRWSLLKPDTSMADGMPIASRNLQSILVPQYDADTGALSSVKEIPNALAVEGIETNLAKYTGRGTLMTIGADLHVFGNDYNLEAQIDALENRKLVKTLANPKVATLNNIPATIEIKQNIPYVEAVQGPSANTTTQEVEFEEAGILLEVLPNITNNGFVRMQIKPQQKIDRGRFLNIPVIDERALEANVIVKDESTVVLGGLRQIENANDTEAVPWVHKIPVLGWAFKGKETSNDKLELVLFVTPHIIKEEPMLNPTEIKQYEMIDYNWKSDEYYDKVDLQNSPAGNIVEPRQYDGVGFNK